MGLNLYIGGTMNKAAWDILVIIIALAAGSFVAVINNPLTATFVLLGIIGVWELFKFLPSLMAEQKNSKV